MPDTPETADESAANESTADESAWAFKTADSQLHTGSESGVDPEDLVMLSGREPTPERIEKARRALEEDGAAAVERLLP